MGHHINKNGFFQSDKHPELPEHKIILDFRDEIAQAALHVYAQLTQDNELAEDILIATENIKKAGLTRTPKH